MDPVDEEIASGADDTPAHTGRAARHPAVIFACGLGMGLSDAVPGVSGGTMALILGIYERLIAALAAMLAALARPLDPLRRRDLWTALAFLIPLGAGIVIALVAALSLLVGDKPEVAGLEPEEARRRLEAATGLLIDPDTAPLVFAFFFGLVCASVREPWRRRRSRRGADLALVAAGTAASAALALLPSLGAAPGPAMFVLSGAIAISVMLLPGISGSLALLVLGMYQPIAGAVHERDLATVAWVVLGVALGGAAFVPCLRLLLDRAHDRTMAALTGLMAGSLVALWPWKRHYLPEAIPVLDEPMLPVAPHGAWWWPLLAAAAGAGLILALSRLARRRLERA